MRLKRLFFLFLYYGLARYLPASNAPWSFGSGKLRRLCAKKLFKNVAKILILSVVSISEVEFL